MKIKMPNRPKEPWYEKLKRLLGKERAAGSSKHGRGKTTSATAKDKRKAKRRNARFARAVTFKWPRGRKR